MLLFLVLLDIYLNNRYLILKHHHKINDDAPTVIYATLYVNLGWLLIIIISI